jgi:hypothetical protein
VKAWKILLSVYGLMDSQEYLNPESWIVFLVLGGFSACLDGNLVCFLVCWVSGL